MSLYDPQNLASRSRKPRPNTSTTTKPKSKINYDDEEDIFKEILSNASNTPINPPKKQNDDFERQLMQENMELEKQLMNDDDLFKDSNEFNNKNTRVKPNIKTAQIDDDDIDDVLNDLGVGPSGMNVSKPEKKENPKDNQLKNKKKALFLSSDVPTPRDDDKNDKNQAAVTKPKSLLNKHKLDGASRDMMNDSVDKSDKNVADLKKNMKNTSGNYSFNKNDDEFSDDDVPLPGTNTNNKKKGGYQQSEAVNSEEVRILNYNIKNLQDRIDQLTKEKDAIYKFEQEKQINEVNKLNMIHKQEIENLKSNQEFNKAAMQRMFEEEKNRTSSIHTQEIETLKKTYEFKEENQRRQYESKISGFEGSKKQNEDLTSMSDNVKNNLDELKEILKSITFYKSKEENDSLEKYSKKNDMLNSFEASLQERVKDLEKQREGLESMRQLLEDQLKTNSEFFVEERSRLKEKQQFMDELKQKYEEVISNQKQQLLSEQNKIKKLEDELHFKSVELKRKSEQQENHIQKELGDLDQQKQEISRYKENLEIMLSKERAMIDDERHRMKKDREDFMRDKLSFEEISNEIKREKESLTLEIKNQEIMKSKMEEEKENVTRIAQVMQQRSLYISEKDAELMQEKTEIENMKFEIERDKTKLKTDLHTIEQKKQDLIIKTKAFENMRFNISKEMSSFEEEKSNYFRTSQPTNLISNSNINSATATFIQESKFIDQSLFKRDVSPLRLNQTNEKDRPSSAFNLDKYLSDLDKKQNKVTNDEYINREQQELIDNKFEKGYGSQDQLMRGVRNRNGMFKTLNLANTNSGSSIGLSARQMKHTPMSMKSIGLVSATDLNSDDKRQIDQENKEEFK